MGEPLVDKREIQELFPGSGLIEGDIDPPTTSTPVAPVEELRWRSEQLAFDRVAMALGINEEMIDQFPTETRQFFSAFVGAVDACHIGMPGGHVDVMDIPEIRDLYALATQEGEAGLAFLQQFATDTTQNRETLKADAAQTVPEVNANIFYGRAMHAFQGRQRARKAQSSAKST